jgi:hypothetical protein
MGIPEQGCIFTGFIHRYKNIHLPGSLLPSKHHYHKLRIKSEKWSSLSMRFFNNLQPIWYFVVHFSSLESFHQIRGSHMFSTAGREVCKGWSSRIMFALCGLLFLAAGSRAQTTLCYQGNDFSVVSGSFSTSDAISGCVSLSTSLAANGTQNYASDIVNFNFTAGPETFTNLNSQLDYLNFTTSAGDITHWAVLDISGSGSGFLTLNLGLLTADAAEAMCKGTGINVAQAGSWSDPGPVPEPTSLLLMLSGMLLVGIKLIKART